jgi:AcrR family transcriptional regulator
VASRRRVGVEAILAEAREIVSEGGSPSLTFQKLASRLGVSKQAIIYWFPTKQDLARELVLPLLRAEADAAVTVLDGASSASDAIARFVRGLAAHHLADLGGFRLIYLATQLDSDASRIMNGAALEEVHGETSRMYGALERSIAADPHRRVSADPRRAAVAVHMAVIGLLTMVALADAVGDPLAHRTDALTDALVSLLG